MIYIKNVTNVTKTLPKKCHQNVIKNGKTKYCIKRNPGDRISYKVYEIFCKFVFHHLCIAQSQKFHNTLDNFYFEVILVQDQASCEVTNVTNRYMNFILDLELNFQRPVCLDSNRKHYYESKTRWKHVCTRNCSHWKIEIFHFFLVTNVTQECAFCKYKADSKL